MVRRPERYTEQAQEVLTASQEAVQRFQHAQWDIEHLLLAFLEMDEGVPTEILRRLGVDVDRVRRLIEEALNQSPRLAYRPTQIYATPQVQRALENANEEAVRLKDEFVGTEHLFIALTMEREGEIGRIFKDAGIELESIYRALAEIRGSQRVTDPRAESKYRSLEKYSIDLTNLAQQGKLDPVVHRDGVIRRVMQVLTRRKKNNPVLIGEAGVGKTAIAEGLAQRIIQEEIPDSLKGKRILALDI